MKQFVKMDIQISKKILSSGSATIELSKGIEISVRVVDSLPDRYQGVKVSNESTVVLTPSDLAELEKALWLNNRYAGQEMAVHLLPPRTDDTKKTEKKGK